LNGLSCGQDAQQAQSEYCGDISISTDTGIAAELGYSREKLVPEKVAQAGQTIGTRPRRTTNNRS